MGYKVSKGGRQIVITEKDVEKCSVYYNSILRVKVEYCTVLVVLFLTSLSLNTKQSRWNVKYFN